MTEFEQDEMAYNCLELCGTTETEEVWKQYNDTYYVSNNGKVKNTNWHNLGKSKLCSQNADSSGYLQVNISCRTKAVHRLVYETFVGPIPKGYDVHHINHNKQDNRLENLCLIESYTHRKIHVTDSLKANCKPVLQYTLDGQFVAEYQSLSEASRQTGIPKSNISCCCNKKIKTNERGTHTVRSAGGYIWRFKL